MLDNPLLKPRFDDFPRELTERPQWVLWRAEWLADKGKYSKVPYQARKQNAKASSTDPATWATLDEARAAYERNPAPHADPEGGFAGVGFVLSESDPFCGVDLDHVIGADGTLSAEALAAVAALDTYAEVSPSGTGVRLFLIGNLPSGGRKRGDVECYESGRFLTVTGRRIPAAPRSVNERQTQIEAFHAAHFPTDPKPGAESQQGAAPLDLSDSDLLAQAFRAANGAKIAALYGGSAVGYVGESEADFALCALLAFYCESDPARLERLLRGSRLTRDKWDDRRGTETWIGSECRRAIASCKEFYHPKGERKADAAPRNPKPKYTPDFGDVPDSDSDLPTVVLTDRADRAISGESWAAVIAANEPPRVFSRGTGAVCLMREAETGRVAVGNMDAEKMLHLLRRAADFVTVQQTKAGPRHTHAAPPLRIARDMLEEVTCGAVALPVLRGVVYAPVVAPDGSLLTEPGYNARARLYVATEGLAVSVPTNPTLGETCFPTLGDALAALDRLFGEDGVFGEFPYASDADRAGAVGLLLTPFLRPYIGGNVPMVLVEAPEKGTGKSLLARNLIRVSCPQVEPHDAPTGRKAEDAEAEWSKLLVTALREAPPVLFLDNVQGVLASSSLARILTSPDPVSDRLLGTNNKATIYPDLLTIVATSNNPEASEDMARRVNIIRLDANMERPTDRRDFRLANLDAHVRANRAAMIEDVLTILHAWIGAGRPEGAAHKASYEKWAAVLSGVLDFIGVSGFLSNEGGFAAFLDPEKAKWAAFARACHDAHGQDAKQARELTDLAINAELVDGSERSPARSLGKKLQSARARVYDGLKLLAVTGRGGTMRYSFRKVDGKRSEHPGDMGDGGFGGFGGF